MPEASTTPPAKVRPTIRKRKQPSAVTPPKHSDADTSPKLNKPSRFVKLNEQSYFVIMMSDGEELQLRPDEPIRFTSDNPKRSGSGCFKRFAKYRVANKVQDAVDMGCKLSDLKWDLEHGYAELFGKSFNLKPAKEAKAEAEEKKEVDEDEIEAPAVVQKMKPKVKKVKKVKLMKKRSGKIQLKLKFGATVPATAGGEGLQNEKKKKDTDKGGKTCLGRKGADKKAFEARRKQEVPAAGGWPEPPSHWPAGVRVDLAEPVPWLPKGWGQGMKTTCASKLRCFVSPEGKLHYSRQSVEQALGVPLPAQADPAAALKWSIQRATDCIRDKMLVTTGKQPEFDDPSKLYAKLSDAERKALPKSPNELHWAVISARRATDARGLKLIAAVQAALTIGGAHPVWYVDEASLQSYRALGVTAKVGGKLVPARNMALDDASALKKPCVQISDDISLWEYLQSDVEKLKSADLKGCNTAAKNAERLKITPVAAASFMLAKMRAARTSNGAGPHLSGVFPLGNHGLAFSQLSITTNNFILGDFFVADYSPCRFDVRMTLKEDYDYTCTHLKQYGSVLRCNRLFIRAVHQTNAGGAVSERDTQGEKERQNIKLLMEKWPGVFRLNPRRGGGDTEVVMKWRE